MARYVLARPMTLTQPSRLAPSLLSIHPKELMLRLPTTIEVWPSSRGKGYLDDAIADFTSALNRNPKFVDAFKNRGLAYKMQGASDKAIEDFNQAIRLDGNSPGLYNLRGAALLDKLEFNRAIADFEKAISLNQKYRNAFINRRPGVCFHKATFPRNRRFRHGGTPLAERSTRLPQSRHGAHGHG